MPAFKRDSASRLRDAERCMKGGEPLTMREASFIHQLADGVMGHAQHIDAATVRFAAKLAPGFWASVSSPSIGFIS